MAIYEYKVTLFLEIESEREESALLVEEALTSLIEEEIEGHESAFPSSMRARRCGLRFHDVNEVTATKT